MPEPDADKSSGATITPSPTSGAAPTRGARDGVRDQLRGASFAEGDRMLRPIQRKEGDPPVPKEAATSEGAEEAATTIRNIVPKVHLVFEQLAHALAYEDSLSQTMKDDLHAWGYETTRRAMSGRHGLQFSCFLPDAERAKDDYVRQLHGGKVRPVMAFRGSEGEGDLESDLGEGGVGRSQWLGNEAMIRDQLMDLSGRGRVVVTGHSLGGALAQLTAAMYPGHVSEVVTFQSPAIPAAVVAQLKAHNDAAKPRDQIASTHYQVDGDLIDEIGREHTPGIVVKADVEEDGAIDAHTHLLAKSVTDEDGGAVVKGDPALGGAGAIATGELDDAAVDGAAGKDRLASVTIMSTDKYQAEERNGALEDMRQTSLNIEGRQELEADVTAEVRKRAVAGKRWKEIVAPIEQLQSPLLSPPEVAETQRRLKDQAQTLFRDLWLAEQAIAGRLPSGKDGMLAAVEAAFADQRARPMNADERARTDRYLRAFAGDRYRSTQAETPTAAPQATEDPAAARASEPLVAPAAI